MIDAQRLPHPEFEASGALLKQPYQRLVQTDPPEHAAGRRMSRRRRSTIPAGPGDVVLEGRSDRTTRLTDVLGDGAAGAGPGQGRLTWKRPRFASTGLTKYYGPVVGVEGLSLDVPAGEVFGFLGANGAGQDDDDPAAARSAAADQRHGVDARVRLPPAEARRPPPHRVPAGRDADVSRADRRGVSEVSLRARPAAVSARVSSRCCAAST